MAVKSISIPDKLIEYLNSKPNASKYVCNLIFKDMEEDGEDFQSKIENIVMKVLENKQLQPIDTIQQFSTDIDDFFEEYS